MEGEMSEESLKSFLENFGKSLVSDYTEVNNSLSFILTNFRNIPWSSSTRTRNIMFFSSFPTPRMKRKR